MAFENALSVGPRQAYAKCGDYGPKEGLPLTRLVEQQNAKLLGDG
jgi:hypothetical protein